MPLTPEQTNLLRKWQCAATELDQIKQTEMQLRKLIVDTFFDPELAVGTQNLELENGYKLKAEKRENYTLKNSNGETDEMLKKFPPEVAKLLVRWKPELNLKNYKALSQPEYFAYFDGCLEIKPGAPSLEIIPPKVKAT